MPQIQITLHNHFLPNFQTLQNFHFLTIFMAIVTSTWQARFHRRKLIRFTTASLGRGLQFDNIRKDKYIVKFDLDI